MVCGGGSGGFERYFLPIAHFLVCARRLCAAAPGASCFLCNALSFILAQINLASSAPGAAAIRQIHTEIIASVAAF
jgi:hypothetical protein